MKYSGRWTANLQREEKARFEQLLGINNKVLDRLVEMCYNMSKESENISNDFDSPNWALRQANSIGYRRALAQVIELCTPAKERDPA